MLLSESSGNLMRGCVDRGHPTALHCDHACPLIPPIILLLTYVLIVMCQKMSLMYSYIVTTQE